MLRSGNDLGCIAGCDNFALTQHDDMVGDFGHDAEVVGDEQHVGSVFLLQVTDQFEDLQLCGHVKIRCSEIMCTIAVPLFFTSCAEAVAGISAVVAVKHARLNPIKCFFMFKLPIRQTP